MGYIVLSFISDNYGRKKSLLISWFSAIIGILLLFYYIHVGLVLILVGSESSIRICLIILSEIASNSIRQKYSIGLMISFGVAGIGVGVIYYLIDDWVAVNIFLLFFSLISFFFLCYYLEEMTKFVIKG